MEKKHNPRTGAETLSKRPLDPVSFQREDTSFASRPASIRV